MNIYFTASARSKINYSPNLTQVFRSIERLGHTNLDDFVIKVDDKKLYDGKSFKIETIYKNAIRLVTLSDIIILEVSEPSISMGYVLNTALELGKPVILLHVKNKYPIFVSGITNQNLQVIEYSLSNLHIQLSTALSCATTTKFTRFNFFLSPLHDNHLTKMARIHHVPKSVYLRELIENDISHC